MPSSLEGVSQLHNFHGKSRIFFSVPTFEDANLATNFVCSLNPKPEFVKRKKTEDENSFVIYFCYRSVEESFFVRNLLHGQRFPSTVNPDYKLDVQFAFHTGETCAYFMFRNKRLTIDDYAQIFTKYPTFLGYRIIAQKAVPGSLSVLIRFLSVDDCKQSVQELREMSIDSMRVIGCISHHDKIEVANQVKDQVERRKTLGLPDFQEVYTKRNVSVAEFNDIIMSQSEQWFSDIEDSRWSSVPYCEYTHEKGYLVNMWKDQLYRL